MEERQEEQLQEQGGNKNVEEKVMRGWKRIEKRKLRLKGRKDQL